MISVATATFLWSPGQHPTGASAGHITPGSTFVAGTETTSELSTRRLVPTATSAAWGATTAAAAATKTTTTTTTTPTSSTTITIAAAATTTGVVRRFLLLVELPGHHVHEVEEFPSLLGTLGGGVASDNADETNVIHTLAHHIQGFHHAGKSVAFESHRGPNRFSLGANA